MINQLYNHDLISPPKWMVDNRILSMRTGSIVYGCNRDTSDNDIIDISVPLIENVYPHLQGYINGFIKPPDPINVYHKAHIEFDNRNIDVTIYSLVKFVYLAMKGNPNIIDILFTPEEHILYRNEYGNMLIENKEMFLTSNVFYKFGGWIGSERKKLLKSFDEKSIYHLVRVTLELEEIVENNSLTLGKNGEFLLSIRNGEFSLEWILNMVEEKENKIKELFHQGNLKEPDEMIFQDFLSKILDKYYTDTNQRNISR